MGKAGFRLGDSSVLRNARALNLAPRGRRRDSLVGAAAAVVLALTSVGAAQAATPAGFANDLYRDRHLIERAAIAELGSRYACTVATPGRGRARDAVLLYVVGRDSVRKARGLRSELKQSKRLKVRVTTRRQSSRAMRRVLVAVKAFQPHTVEATAIAVETPLGRRRCPRVEIALLPRGQASEDQEQWAARMVKRYRRDRVVVRRAGLTERRGRT